jgi:hypothetical protein
MGSELTRFGQGAALSRREERQFSKALAQIQTGAGVELARVRAIEAVECAKVEAVEAVATVGLLAVSNLSSTEAVLFERTPHAGPRLKFVADSASASIAQVVAGVNRSLR